VTDHVTHVMTEN